MPSSVGKISVAIARKELEWARARAKREGTSLSSVLTTAARTLREQEARQKRQDTAWSAFLDWATGGEELSAAELEEARLALAAGKRKPRAKRRTK